MSIHNLALMGKHNKPGTLAGIISERRLEIQKDLLREQFTNMHCMEHRLEFVARVNGINFINDSKATNINSTWYALESIDGPIILIAGGVDKGNDYSELNELVSEKVKMLICIGRVDNARLINAFREKVDHLVECESMMEAVARAYDFAKENDTVLLSPACASFDRFEDYEDRGREFRKAVKSI